jgi:hypothetical protein
MDRIARVKATAIALPFTAKIARGQKTRKRRREPAAAQHLRAQVTFIF